MRKNILLFIGFSFLMLSMDKEQNNFVDSNNPLSLVKHINGDRYAVAYYNNECDTSDFLAASQFRFYDTKQTGVSLQLHNNGEIMEQISFLNGRLNGSYKCFDSTGVCLAEGMFNLNAKVGKWNYYDKKGALQKEVTYSGKARIYKSLLYEGKDSIAVYGRDNELIDIVHHKDAPDSFPSIFPYCRYFVKKE